MTAGNSSGSNPCPTPTPGVANGTLVEPIQLVAPPPSKILPAIGIIQILITLVLAFVLWRLTFSIFVSNAEQKIAERQAEWFHKIVVDRQLDKLNSFCDSARDILENGIESCKNAIETNHSLGAEEAARIAINGFNAIFVPQQRQLSDILICFNKQLAQRSSERFARLQEDATGLIEAVVNSDEGGQRNSPAGIVSSFRSDLITLLHTFEFSTYGFRRPSLWKSLFGRNDVRQV